MVSTLPLHADALHGLRLPLLLLSIAILPCTLASTTTTTSTTTTSTTTTRSTSSAIGYHVEGVVDVFTDEMTIFFWQGRLLSLENIACEYWDHAGLWQPDVFGNHSYARIRDLNTGQVLSNVTSSVGYGFISAFPDYSTDTLWLFGTPVDRCVGNGQPKTVQAWWSKDLHSWQTRQAFNYGQVTHNVQVTRVGPLAGSSNSSDYVPPSDKLPPHSYAMMLECFAFAVSNGTNGNLTDGWVLINSNAPKTACGGPSMRFNPKDGFYYILTGGDKVHLLRTRDFQSWQESNPAPFISPSADDARVANLSGFPAQGTIKGSPPNKAVGVPEPYPHRPFVPYWRDNWQSWSKNSNDADMCCMHANVTQTTLLWGASTQGKAPLAPLDGTDAGVNVVATADAPLTDFLASYFS